MKYIKNRTTRLRTFEPDWTWPMALRRRALWFVAALWAWPMWADSADHRPSTTVAAAGQPSSVGRVAAAAGRATSARDCSHEKRPDRWKIQKKSNINFAIAHSLRSSQHLPLSGMWTVPRKEHPHVVVVVVVVARRIRSATVDAAILYHIAGRVHLGRQEEVGIVSLQWRCGFAVLALGRLRLHVVVGAVATRR